MLLIPRFNIITVMCSNCINNSMNHKLLIKCMSVLNMSEKEALSTLRQYERLSKNQWDLAGHLFGKGINHHGCAGENRSICYHKSTASATKLKTKQDSWAWRFFFPLKSFSCLLDKMLHLHVSCQILGSAHFGPPMLWTSGEVSGGLRNRLIMSQKGWGDYTALLV